jgi:hypothetical protein
MRRRLLVALAVLLALAGVGSGVLAASTSPQDRGGADPVQVPPPAAR